MDKRYKGHTIIVHAEQDDFTDLWNGRYRILDDVDRVGYESFTEAASKKGDAISSAEAAARKWVNQR